MSVKRDDLELDFSLRPKRLDDYLGQTKVKESLGIMIDAARARGDVADHILFSGPPGLGKTTLATVVANELGASIRTTSGPAIARTGDLAAILTNLEEGRRAPRRRAALGHVPDALYVQIKCHGCLSLSVSQTFQRIL